MKIDQSEEETIWRPAPPRPYQPSGRVLEVPRAALEQLLEKYRLYVARQVEAGCFWYGRLDEVGNGSVEAVVIPRQRNSWGNYHVEAGAMTEVSAATRPFGWRNVAQIHTHPGPWVEHSRYDDLYANSARTLSIVLPDYGEWRGTWPAGVGVHEYQVDYWHLLTDEEASRRVFITETTTPIQVVDLR